MFYSIVEQFPWNKKLSGKLTTKCKWSSKRKFGPYLKDFDDVTALGLMVNPMKEQDVKVSALKLLVQQHSDQKPSQTDPKVFLTWPCRP